MIKFLFRGILRDKNRSLLPIIIITIGVTLTILLSHGCSILQKVLITI
jgi:putative ABC transport system permease protein